MWVLPFFCQKLLWHSVLLLLSYTNQLLKIPWMLVLVFVSLALIPHLLLITILQQNVILNVGLTIILPKRLYILLLLYILLPKTTLNVGLAILQPKTIVLQSILLMSFSFDFCHLLRVFPILIILDVRYLKKKLFISFYCSVVFLL